MAWEHREGHGSLFRNKSENPKAPTHKGDFMLDGKLYTISAWTKEGAKGKFFSLKVEPKRDGSQSAPQREKPAPVEDFNDDVPFIWAIALPLIPFLLGVSDVGQNML